jgi:hypothetical protein
MRKTCGMVLVGMLALAGCGGDDDGSGDTSGVDSSSTLDELTAAEANDFCEWSAGLIDTQAIVDFTCYVAAIVASQQSEDVVCEDFAADCIDQTEPPSDAIECQVDADLPDCASEVTVGEFEDCLIAFVDQLVDIIDDVSCDTALEDLPEDIGDVALPAACMSIQEVCPDLFESDGE